MLIFSYASIGLTILSILLFLLLNKNILKSIELSKNVIYFSIMMLISNLILYVYLASVNFSLLWCIKCWLILLTIFILFFFIDYMYLNKIVFVEFPLYLTINLIGLFGAMDSNDLFTFFLCVELQTFIIVVLCCLKGYSLLGIEASLRYIFLSYFFFCSFLLGSFCIYYSFGTLIYSDLCVLVKVSVFDGLISKICIIGLLLILVSFFFKLGVYPFHYWLVDVYEGSPMIVTLYLSVIPKMSLLYALHKILIFIFGEYYFIWSNILVFFSVMSIIYSVVMALYQTRMKRLLAYGTINHMGWMLLGMLFDLKICIFYYMIYSISSIVIFGILMLYRGIDGNKKIKRIVDLYELKYNNVLLFFFLINVLSFSGLPPFGGFFVKYWILKVLILNGFSVISVIIFLVSLISVVYYIRLIRFIFFKYNEELKLYYNAGYEVSLISSVIITVLSLIILFFILIFF